MPEYTDSVEKVIQSYFAGVCRTAFQYGGKTYEPKNLIVSHLIFRGYTCPEHCGGCCPRFSLDYIQGESIHPNIKGEGRTILFNGHEVPVYSDMQADHNNHHCRNLIHENGRCGVHGKQPFSCDFELIRFIHQRDRVILTQKLFGRGWAFLRTDNKRGALCEMLPVTKETVEDVIRKLIRLKQWAEYFGVDHCLDAVIDWAKAGSGLDLLIPKNSKRGIVTSSLLDLDDREEPLIQIQKGNK
jgi:hypothetical protein